MTRPLRQVPLGPRAVSAARRSDGSLVLASPHALGNYPAKITERLEHWASVAPDRAFLAQRDGSGGWRKLTYSQALRSARSIGAGLLQRNLSTERPLLVLSGPSIEHGLLELAALYVGIPYAPVSPAYSLLSSDFGKLRHIVRLLTPGLVYAAGENFKAAIAATVPSDVPVVFNEGLSSLYDEKNENRSMEAHQAVGPDTIAKFLFTSGSTGMPKAVINTQRMWCANQAMILAGLPYFADQPPVLVDWAPWHHTAGGNHDFGLALCNGGTFYIDEGKPLPGAIEETVRNLKEVSPTWYFTVPKGYEALLPFLRADEKLRATFFRDLKVLWFAGAGVSQHVFDEMNELSFRACGEVVPFLTGYGSTETAPAAMVRTWEAADASNLGLPVPGVQMKLVPAEGKLEARFKGPNVTPGYWRQPELTAKAFDEEGWYRIGDAFVLADPGDAAQGLLFRGRFAEDFKLSSGTWVHVGTLRSQLIEHCAPLVRDVVIAGLNRAEIGALLFLNSRNDEALGKKLESFAAKSTGSSNLVARAMILEEPPSLDAGEMTDKGSINQRAVLERRAALVEELYREPLSPRVILCR
jgi:feruloyl-CoA synthase